LKWRTSSAHARSTSKLTDGLNVIGGANHQGKTSILDGIAMAIGGARQVGSNPINNDAKLDEKRTVASTQVEFSNGVLAKRGFTVKNEKGNLGSKTTRVAAKEPKRP